MNLDSEYLERQISELQQGIAQARGRLAQLQQEAENVRTNIIASQGAVQAYERLLMQNGDGEREAPSQ